MTRVLRKLTLLTLLLAILLSVALPAVGMAEAAPKAESTFRFDRKTLVLYVGERYDMPSFLEPTQTGGTVDASTITWKTSNGKVVSMNKKSGLAIGQKVGVATITATQGKNKATIKLIVKRNKLDFIYGKKPSLSIANYMDYELVLKSIEITKPNTVVCEYYLIFNYPKRYRSTYFDDFYADISAYDTYYEEDMMLVQGSPKGRVRVSCRGKQVKVFKVTFTGASVLHTDIALPKCSRKTVDDHWEVYLNWKY